MSDYMFVKRGSIKHKEADSESSRKPAQNNTNIGEFGVSSTVEEARSIYTHKEKKMKSRILDSTQRSLKLLRNTENIAESTNKELLIQREQLLRTNENLNDIQSSLMQCKKHINKIKNPFSFLKEFVSEKRDVVFKKKHKEKSHLSKPDDMKIEEKMSLNDHPCLRLKGICDRDSRNSYSSGNVKEVDESLDEISQSVFKLKSMAVELGKEIDLQNNLLDEMTGKTEKALVSIQNQNKDVKALMK